MEITLNRERAELIIGCPADGWTVEKRGTEKAAITFSISASVSAMQAPRFADRIMDVARFAASLDRAIRDEWDLRELDVYEWDGAKFPFYDTGKRCLVLPVQAQVQAQVP